MRKRGQSTLEYVIVLTAIVTGILWAVNEFIGRRNTDTGMGMVFEQGAKRITNASYKLPGADSSGLDEDPGSTQGE